MPDRFYLVREMLAALDQEIRALGLTRDEDLPEDVRYKLLVLACSLRDFTFWVRRRPQEDDAGELPGDQMYCAQEIESGGEQWGVTPREALDRHFRRDVLDLQDDDGEAFHNYPEEKP
jgi:hypothetical protein